MLVIGDVHGKYGRYKDIIKGVDTSIQLGDFGFQREHDWHIANVNAGAHKVIFGNHDYYPYLDKPHSLGNWSYNNDIFTVRGAWSIDKVWRTEGLDWFVDEELTYTEMREVINAYEKIKPRIVISHECPNTPRQEFFGIWQQSSTSHGLQVMWEMHQPEIWLFGHHHVHKDQNINGTRFICLPELGVFNI